MRVDSAGGSAYNVIMEIMGVTQADAGTYKVTAKNRLGEVSASINLNFSGQLIPVLSVWIISVVGCVSVRAVSVLFGLSLTCVWIDSRRFCLEYMIRNVFQLVPVSFGLYCENVFQLIYRFVPTGLYLKLCFVFIFHCVEWLSVHVCVSVCDIYIYIYIYIYFIRSSWSDLFGKCSDQIIDVTDFNFSLGSISTKSMFKCVSV